MNLDPKTYQLASGGKFGVIMLLIGGLGLAASVAGYFVDSAQFFHSWLASAIYWLSISLGALFFVLLHYLVGAKWSVVLRRLAENLASPLIFLAICMAVILFGLKELFHWADPEIVATDHLLQGKAGYLNQTFFIIRMVGYFLIWIVLWRFLFSGSLKQDTQPSAKLTKRMRIISAPGMFLFALTLTFASFDWMMSLDAHWYSTIFGVYIFSGSFLSAIAFLSIAVVALRSRGYFKGMVTGEHFHDLGKLMFAFVIFWGYMAFSQYFLIWYGNIPEETVWFLHRWEGSWKTVSLIIVFGHFVIPFFALFPQTPKKNPVFLVVVSVWLLIVHRIDIYWLVMPSLHHHGVHLSWMDGATIIGIGGIFLWCFWRRLVKHPLVPIQDPDLEASFKSRS
jgi:hypothetical protein